MGSIISVEQPRRSSPPLERPRRTRTPGSGSRGPLAGMMEHAIGAAATVPEFIEAPDDDSDGDGPIVTLLARADELASRVDADDAVWREAARTGSPLYDVEIRAVGAAWRAVATGSAERRHRVEGLRPNVACMRAGAAAAEQWGRRRACSGAQAARRRGSGRRHKDGGKELKRVAWPPASRTASTPTSRTAPRLIPESHRRQLCAAPSAPLQLSVPHRVPGPGGMRLDGRGGEDVGGGARSH